jgi:ABC-2 type transport system ATP-binding protein
MTAAAATPAPPTLAGATPTLGVWGVRKRWGDQIVLDGVDLRIDPGTAIHVSGRNGTGKTTLLRIAVGLIHADSGSVELDGLDPVRDRRAYQSRLGFLSAGDRGLYARVSVRDHLRLWARLALLPRSRTGEVIDRALDAFDLRELAARRVERLSMGQRQRVRLAGVFLHDPSIVLLDEPRTSLDGDGIRLLTSLLEDFRSGGGAIVWSSPTGERAELDFDVSYTLEEGRLWAR